MRIPILAIAVFSLAVLSGAAEAKGCLVGAAVGGVAGHVAGKHGVLGAAAGCAVRHHEANKKNSEASAATQSAAVPTQPPKK